MNKDQIFMDAIKGSRKDITREFISKIISEDKTNTIRKYLASYGITQLAIHMQELGRIANPPKLLNVKISDEVDIRQKRVQEGKVRLRRKTKPGIFDYPELSYTTGHYTVYTNQSISFKKYATDDDENNNPVLVNDIIYGHKVGPISKDMALNHLKTKVKNSVTAKKKPLLASVTDETVVINQEPPPDFGVLLPNNDGSFWWMKDSSADEAYEPEI